MDEMATSMFYECRRICDEDRQRTTVNQVHNDLQDQDEYFSDDEDYDLLVKRSNGPEQDWIDDNEDADDDVMDSDDVDDDDYVDSTEEGPEDGDRESEVTDVVDLEEDVMADYMMDELQTIPKAALLAWISEIGAEKIDGTYQVYHELPPKRPHYVVLLKDQSYLCTCRLQQSKGIVCGHFFRLMRTFPEFQYHISLISSRWFMEAIQDKKDLKDAVMDEDAVYAESFAQRMTSKPSIHFKTDYFSVFPEGQSALDPQGVPSSRSMRYGRLHGKWHSLISMGAESSESTRRVEKILDQGFAEIRGGTRKSSHGGSDSGNDSVRDAQGEDGDPTTQTGKDIHIFEGVQDIKTVATKGRKRKIRYKAACEVQITSLKKGLPYAPTIAAAEAYHDSTKRRKKTQCSHCGAEGHNARTCKAAKNRR